MKKAIVLVLCLTIIVSVLCILQISTMASNSQPDVGEIGLADNPFQDPEPIKNGVIDNHLYIDGDEVPAYTGLVKYNNDYYYVDKDGIIVTNSEKFIKLEKSNGLKLAGKYYFDSTGKMIFSTFVGNVFYTSYGLRSDFYYGIAVTLEGDIYYIYEGTPVKNSEITVTSKRANDSGIEGKRYFGADGKMVYNTAVDTKFYGEDGSPVRNYYGLVKDNNGYYYYVDSNGIIKDYVKTVKSSKINGLDKVAGQYYFDAEGKMVYNTAVDTKFYGEDGSPVRNYYGLVKDNNGYYYYVDSNGIIKDYVKTVKSSKINGLDKVAGQYYFDAEGKMAYNTAVDTMFFGDDGLLVRNYYGLVKDNDGYYYYVDNAGILKDYVKTVKATKLNGLDKVPGQYYFGADGKMQINTVHNDNFYGADGLLTPSLTGLVQDKNGDYYYVDIAKSIIKNAVKTIKESKLNGLNKFVGTYYFGADGKMVYNTVIDDYFYGEDGVRVVPFYGLVQTNDGACYYVDASSKIIKNESKTVKNEKNHTYLPSGTYYFGANGQLKKNILAEDYYYGSNGIRVNANYGLIKYGGYYYYIGENKTIVKNSEIQINADNKSKLNGLLSKEGCYYFDSNGRMVIDGYVGDNYYNSDGIKEGYSQQFLNNLLSQKYNGTYSSKDGALAGVDSLGRVVSMDTGASKYQSGVKKTVGIFYFMWLGQHGSGAVYDNSIIEQVPGATASESAWMAAGGGAQGATHFWSKPLFGYYTTNDTWVMNKHVQMLTDAGIDYIIFDCTNGYAYITQTIALTRILDKYYQQGYNVPKIAFYTNTNSGATVIDIYNNFYAAYPQYSHLWYYYDGKPLIIADTSSSDWKNVSTEIKDFFRIKLSQWPNTTTKKADGFPWMEFSRLLSSNAVYGINGRKEILSISPAQHCATGRMSETAWYGGNDHTRSWHNGSNDTSSDAILYGYNFAEQWNWALKQNVESIFITGWNEWGAQRMPSTWFKNVPIAFIDCANANTSRDIEPMDGLFGDNYYLQMIDGIRRFKGNDDRVNIGDYATDVDITKTSSFNNATAVYTDYVGDCSTRYIYGFGSTLYSDSTGLNDFQTIKVLRDKDYLYFSVTCSKNIKNINNVGRMSLFISNDTATTAINGYNYVINRGSLSDSDKLTVEKWVDGVWTLIGTADYYIDGKTMNVKVSRSLLNMPGFALGAYDLISFNFKWADGYNIDDVFSFYKNGDCAPYGRMNFVYSNKK